MRAPLAELAAEVVGYVADVAVARLLERVFDEEPPPADDHLEEVEAEMLGGEVVVQGVEGRQADLRDCARLGLVDDLEVEGDEEGGLVGREFTVAAEAE